MALTLPYNFQPGTNAASGQVMANFNAIVSYVNDLAIPSIPLTVSEGGTGAIAAPSALTNLGLGGQTIITGTATNSGKNITLTPDSGNPTIAAYTNGLTLAFLAPVALTAGSGQIQIRLLGLALAPLFNTPISTPTPSVALNQLLFVSYSTALSAWVLINTPPGSTAGFVQSSNNGTDFASTLLTLQNLGGAPLLSFTNGLILGASGSQPIAGGLIIKWGSGTWPSSSASSASQAVTFPTPFPNNCFVVQVTAGGNVDPVHGFQPTSGYRNISDAGFTAVGDTLETNTFLQTVPFSWIAFGN